MSKKAIYAEDLVFAIRDDPSINGANFAKIRGYIEAAPPADAVEVVRCKNCKRCMLCYPEKQIGKDATPGWYCKEHKSYRRPDDFCSYGERKDNV
jgi:hypothetical protein